MICLALISIIISFFLLCGELNANVGFKCDLLQVDEIVNENSGIIQEVQESYSVTSILDNIEVSVQRVNQQKLPADDYRRRLTEWCQTTSTHLFNSRAGQDKGRITTTKPGTVVDYVTGLPMLCKALEEFLITDFDPILFQICKT